MPWQNMLQNIQALVGCLVIIIMVSFVKYVFKENMNLQMKKFENLRMQELSHCLLFTKNWFSMESWDFI